MNENYIFSILLIFPDHIFFFALSVCCSYVWGWSKGRGNSSSLQKITPKQTNIQMWKNYHCRSRLNERKIYRFIYYSMYFSTSYIYAISNLKDYEYIYTYTYINFSMFSPMPKFSSPFLSTSIFLHHCFIEQLFISLLNRMWQPKKFTFWKRQKTISQNLHRKIIKYVFV